MDSPNREEVKLLERRLLTSYDFDTLANALGAHMLREAEKGHPLRHLMDLKKVRQWLMWGFRGDPSTGVLDVFEAGDEIVGALGWAVAPIPWGRYSALKELTVFSVGHERAGFGRVVLERLRHLADKHNCAIIETGSALCTDPALLRNLYMGHGGFQWSYPNFVKVL
ncbi:hypothetical protein [Anaeroselena agilis]|uniref:N-acetyltransferase domain-containing protein n=1 Tax=Anaeroselena agilis TaxID=3063788 RepID=A0ABU3NW53_9FIRM|nr:hypothetical protein [Selenomonadales bacterium 4137-cl]